LRQIFDCNKRVVTIKNKTPKAHKVTGAKDQVLAVSKLRGMFIAIEFKNILLIQLMADNLFLPLAAFHLFLFLPFPAFHFMQLVVIPLPAASLPLRHNVTYEIIVVPLPAALLPLRHSATYEIIVVPLPAAPLSQRHFATSPRRAT
jgi:hypothetical protein